MAAKYKVLIDADGIVYRVGFAMEDVNSLTTVKHNVEQTLANYMSDVKRIFVSIEEPTIVLSPLGQENNFRYNVAKTLPYKGNRTAPKPKHYDYIRTVLMEIPGAIIAEGQEADDTIADIAVENPSKTVIVSQDKDMRQVPGWHLEPGSVDEPKRPVYYVDPDTLGHIQLERTTGNRAGVFATGPLGLYSQMMLGDTSDNIPGLENYGPVKVYSLLKDATSHDYSLNSIIRAQYSFMGLEDRFDEIYTLLKIGGHNKLDKPVTFKKLTDKEKFLKLKENARKVYINDND